MMPSSSGDAPAAPEPRACVLDLRGEVCPYTFVRTRLKLEEMQLGDLLEVLLDHEAAAQNVPRSAREWGQEVESALRDDAGVWHLRLRKRVL